MGKTWQGSSVNPENEQRKGTIISGLIVWFLGGFWRTRLTLLGLDLTAALSSFFVSYLIATRIFSAGGTISQYTHSLITLGFFLAVSIYFLNGYKPIEDRRPETELEISVKGIIFGFFAVFVVNFLFFKGKGFSRYIIFLWWIISLIILPFFRLALREIHKSLWRRGYLRERVLLLGNLKGIKSITDNLAIQRHERFDYLGIIRDENSDSDLVNGLPVLGTTSELKEVVESQNVDKVFIVPYGFSYEHVAEISDYCRGNNIPINIVSDEFDAVKQEVKVDEFTGLLTLHPIGDPLKSRVNRLVKRSFDLLGSLVGLPIVGLLYLIIYIAIKIEDKGPVIYRRKVVGKKGRGFDAFKFRSMRVDADKILEDNPDLKMEFEKNFKLKNDPRLTKVGAFIRKYSIDEFPQLLNVFLGQMSLVGPRMIVEKELEKYGEFRERILTVKPGISGFWQVSGRQKTGYDERVKMDMFYIDRWSIWLDIIILMKTFWKVLKTEGAY